MQNVKKQEPESQKFLDVDKGHERYNLCKKMRTKESDFHSNHQMHDCGSFGSRGRGMWSGSMYQRESQPWEAADG